jgi:peptidoglycan/LPS O-acetylase OafA/YrhL
MKSHRIEWLDSIRGLAAIAVLIIHYYHLGLLSLIQISQGNVIASGQSLLEETIQYLQTATLHLGPVYQIHNFILGYYDLGKIGVSLFFFLSGFVVPYSLFAPENPIKRFAISRFFRLYPMYWFSLLLILLFGVSSSAVSIGSIFANLTMFQKFFGMADINGVAWTLQIELVFYICCALLFACRLLKPQNANYAVIGALWLLAIGFACIRLLTGIKTPIAMPLGLSLMFMGYVWRKFLLKEEAIPVRHVGLMGLLFALLIPIVSFMGYSEAGWTYTNTYWIALLLFFSLTTVLRITASPLLFLGKISYSVYLLHAFIGKIIIPFLITLTPQVYKANTLLIFAPMLASTLLTLAIASITYFYIEEPCAKFGKEFTKWLLLPKASRPFRRKVNRTSERLTQSKQNGRG